LCHLARGHIEVAHAAVGRALVVAPDVDFPDLLVGVHLRGGVLDGAALVGLVEVGLDHVADRFLSRVRTADAEAPDDPEARLSAVLDAALSPPEADELEDIQTALLELKTRAPHEPAVRERIETSDGEFRSLLADILTDGVETGVFRADLDSEDTAQTIVTFLAGGQLRQVSLGEDCETERELLETYLDRCVFAEAAE